MLEENGLELARRIISDIADIRIVFITSCKEYALEAFALRAFDYIVKPVSRERLKHTISNALNRRSFLSPAMDKGDSARLTIHCLGRMEIRYMDREIVQLKSSKSTELLAYLLINRSKFISKWSIMEDVFRGMPPKNAETYLNTTTYKLRKALEPYGMRSAIISGNESYRIEFKNIFIDFIDFENRVNNIFSINESNIEYAFKAEKLFEGELFGDKDYCWSLHEKEKLLEVYSSFAKKLVRYLFEKSNITESLRVLKKLICINELDEEVNCFLMRVYAAKRDRNSLIKQYKRYVNMLKRELGVAPEKMTTDLYKALIKSFE